MCANLKFFWKLMNIWTSAVWKAFHQKSWKGFLLENLFSNFQFLKKHFAPPLHPLKLNCWGGYSTWTVRGAAQLGISADTEVSLRGCRGAAEFLSFTSFNTSSRRNLKRPQGFWQISWKMQKLIFNQLSHLNAVPERRTKLLQSTLSIVVLEHAN